MTAPAYTERALFIIRGDRAFDVLSRPEWNDAVEDFAAHMQASDAEWLARNRPDVHAHQRIAAE